ncbi:MAG: exosortase-associated EpsI family protein, partial [Pirellula sp.]
MSDLNQTPVDADKSVATKPNEAQSHQATGADLKRWFLGIASALALILLGGVAHGVLSNRWGVAEDIQSLGKQLNSIPMELGPWKCSEEVKLDDRVVGILEATGYLSRIYVHQATGEAVNVFLVFGPKGPIAVHTPEICYSARAVTQTSERQAVDCSYDGMDGNLWKLGFESNSIDKRKMSVYYGWTDGGPWQAAVSPRFWRTDFLYKIQTSC